MVFAAFMMLAAGMAVYMMRAINGAYPPSAAVTVREPRYQKCLYCLRTFWLEAGEPERVLCRRCG